eukprot:TRINITY_DN3872_c0_g1_i4.p1 TRINITY_DN3872_c0_g1~~TRINITY_DN3872_c0_g1_i4.p1  ORF type:complete len:771 (-),score=76.98 TRINITY_DN3872_c0_g1_i4:211-2523(-)
MNRCSCPRFLAKDSSWLKFSPALSEAPANESAAYWLLSLVVLYMTLATLLWIASVAKKFHSCAFRHLALPRSVEVQQWWLNFKEKVRSGDFCAQTLEAQKVAGVHASIMEKRRKTYFRYFFYLAPPVMLWVLVNNLAAFYRLIFITGYSQRMHEVLLHEVLVQRTWIEGAFFFLIIMVADFWPTIGTTWLVRLLLAGVTTTSFCKLPFLSHDMAYENWLLSVFSMHVFLLHLVPLKESILVITGSSILNFVYVRSEAVLQNRADLGLVDLQAVLLYLSAVLLGTAFASYHTTRHAAMSVVSDLRASTGQAVARGIISSMCDAVVSLGQGQRVLGRIPKFDALLIRSSPCSTEGCQFLDFVHDGEKSRVAEFLNASEGDPTNTRVISTTLVDSQRQPLKVKLYHTSFHDIMKNIEHVIGITEDEEGWRQIPPLEEVPPMPGLSSMSSVSREASSEGSQSATSSFHDDHRGFHSKLFAEEPDLHFKIRLQQRLTVFHESDATQAALGILNTHYNFADLICKKSRQKVLQWLTDLVDDEQSSEHCFGKLQLLHPSTGVPSTYYLVARADPSLEVHGIPEDSYTTSRSGHDFSVYLLPDTPMHESLKQFASMRNQSRRQDQKSASSSSKSDGENSTGMRWPGRSNQSRQQDQKSASSSSKSDGENSTGMRWPGRSNQSRQQDQKSASSSSTGERENSTGMRWSKKRNQSRQQDQKLASSSSTGERENSTGMRWPVGSHERERYSVAGDRFPAEAGLQQQSLTRTLGKVTTGMSL